MKKNSNRVACVQPSLKIHHITKAQHFGRIVSDGILRREGYAIENMMKEIKLGKIPAEMCKHISGCSIEDIWRHTQRQYRLVGRYVWFTEEDDVQCIDPSNLVKKVVLTFDAYDLGARRWVEVMREVSKKSVKARKMVKKLNSAARLCGDDYTKWWVVENDIDLESFPVIDKNNVSAA